MAFLSGVHFLTRWHCKSRLTTDRADLWEALAEKAYAKMQGGYDSLVGVSVAEALACLTGGVVFQMPLTLKALGTAKERLDAGDLLGCICSAKGASNGENGGNSVAGGEGEDESRNERMAAIIPATRSAPIVYHLGTDAGTTVQSKPATDGINWEVVWPWGRQRQDHANGSSSRRVSEMDEGNEAKPHVLCAAEVAQLWTTLLCCRVFCDGWSVVSAVGTLELAAARSPLFILTVEQEQRSYMLIIPRDDSSSGGATPPLEMRVLKMAMYKWDQYSGPEPVR
jgi:hypothetical protein